MMQRPIRLLAFALFLLLSNSIAAKTLTTSEKVVVVGDVHGAYSEFTGLLKELKIVDGSLNWAAGKTHFVSLGDLVDRGPGSRQVVELLIKLQQQAEAAGGGLHVALGNHDVMVMTGDLRYVTEPEFAAFKDLETDADRQALTAAYQKLLDSGQAKAGFEATFPPGFAGMVKAYSPDGELGKWLRQQVAVLNVNGDLMLHGGVSRDMLSLSLEDINKQARDGLQAYDQAYAAAIKAGLLPYSRPEFDGLALLDQAVSQRGSKSEPWFAAADTLVQARNTLLFDPRGPFWYRGNAECPALAESYTLEAVQREFKIKRIIIGHTVKYRRVASRIEGGIILMDTGMLAAYYKGTPSALIIDKGESKAFHAGGKYDGTIMAAPQRFIWNPQGMSDKDVEAFLSSADIVDSKPIGTGITRARVMTLKQGDKTLRASFKKFDNLKDLQNSEKWSKRFDKSDRYLYEVAAYKLDRMMGLYLTPPAVLREVDGEMGAVQYWVEDLISENQRLDRRLGYPGDCALPNYVNLRTVFDTLIYNVDRNNGNLLWDAQFQLVLIDHSQAFASAVGKPTMYRKQPLWLTDLIRKSLQGLSDNKIETAMAPYLHPEQIKALIARRDFILENGEPIMP